MKVIVLNGSPKGEMSVTYHNVLYLEKHFDDVSFEYVHIGKLINKYEKDLECFYELMDKIKDSDLIFWIYPVYTFLIPYQLMKFIELIFERKQEYVFTDKYTTQLSTSKHFYDMTAYNYLHNISETLEMKHIFGHMADMNDLLNEVGRKSLIDFFESIEDVVSKEKYVIKKYKQRKPLIYPFSRNGSENGYSKKLKKESNIVVIYNGLDYSLSLKNMINELEDLCSYSIHKVDLSHIDVKGGCLGCLKCTFTGHCVYKDDFENIHKNKIENADVVLYASDIKNHWMHLDFKKFSDRSFFNGHRISTKGKGIGYLISGPLRDECNLRDVMEARADVSGMYLLDIVTDEDIDTQKKIERLSDKIDYFMDFKPERPISFWGVGGMKIFRDLVYEMRFLMVEDHKFYKKEKLYDFPKKRRLLNMLLFFPMKLMMFPKIFKKIEPKLLEYMIRIYQKKVDKF